MVPLYAPDHGVPANDIRRATELFSGLALGRVGLCQVAAWLVLGGLVAEAMQFSLLCEHRARHVWRSHAFAT
eukprot:4040491-Pyramimonas_sp.AAC.1